MAILIDEKKRVLVPGITGREGRARTKLMREYGTQPWHGLEFRLQYFNSLQDLGR